MSVKLRFRFIAAIGLVTAMAVGGGCSRSPQEKYAGFLDRGKKQIAAQDYPRAILEFQNAAQVMPKKADAYYHLGLAYLGANRQPQAAAALRKATELDPADSRAQVKLAEMMVQTHDAELAKDAELRVRKVLLSNPGDLDALFILAATQVELGKPGEAEKYLKEALERSPQHIKSILALAQMKLSQKNAAAAEKLLKTAVERAPNAPEASIALAVFYAGDRKLAEAEHLLRNVIGQDPKNAAALVRLGAIQLKVGEKDEAEQTYKQIAALPSRDLKPAYGAFLMQQGRRDEGIAEFERLAKADPVDRTARSRLVAAYAAAGRWADAEKILNEALAKNPKDADALFERSQLYLRKEKFREAQNDLEAVIRYEPTAAQAHYLLGLIYKSLDSLSQEKKELGEALRLDPQLLAARTEMANALFASNATAAALATLNDAPEPQKHTLAWVVAHNWALISEGNHAEARKGVDQALSAGRLPDAVTQDGVLKLTLKDVAGARADFEEVLKRNPGDVRALSLLAQSYSMQDQRAAGTEKLRQYVAQQPKSFKMQMLWANWLLTNHNTSEARQALAAAKAAEPKNVAVDELLARVDFMEGKIDDAQRRLSAVLDAEPAYVPAHILLGTLQIQANNNAQAIKHFQAVIGLDPANLTALNNLAFLLARDPARLDEALKFAQHAKELAPEESHVRDTLGWVYFQKGLYPMAAQELEGAFASDPRPSVKFHLGVTYLKMGNSKGRELIAGALQTDPKLAETEVWK